MGVHAPGSASCRLRGNNGYIASLRCSFKTLRLSCRFRDSHYDPSVWSRNPGAYVYDITSHIVNNKGIKVIITDLGVEQSIQISVISHPHWGLRETQAYG